MATVTIGSARSDERGAIVGGKAGDQKKGKEVSTQGWYRHNKGWRVIRCKIPEARPLIGRFMREACDNNNIGYDQYQRAKKGSLRVLLPDFKYIIKAVNKACETDCSALVGDCITCALRAIGRKDEIPNFTTGNELRTLLATGLFEEMKGTKYTNGDDYLLAGDILVTKSKGHTVICLTNGEKSGAGPVPDKVYNLGDRELRNDDEGADVKELQSLLIQLAGQTKDDNYLVGKWGADGDFGDATEMAVMYLQKSAGLPVTGVVNAETIAALEKLLGFEDGDGDPVNASHVRIVNGNCWVRTAPNTTGKKLGVAKEGTELPYQGQQSVDGWYLVVYEGQNAWVSGKYAELVKR